MQKRQTAGLLAASQPAKQSDFCRTLSGVSFPRNAAFWNFRDGLIKVSIDFRGIPAITPDVVEAERATLCWYLENRAASTSLNLHERFVDFCKYLQATEPDPVGELREEHFLNYRASLRRDQEHQLGSLRTLLKKWFAMRLPGISPRLHALLQTLRISGGIAGGRCGRWTRKKGPSHRLNAYFSDRGRPFQSDRGR
jgi:hypothetical protein